MSDPILPSAATVVTPLIDAIVALRPESLSHFNSPASQWSKIAAIVRAMAATNLVRMGDEVRSARLRTATGDSLRALCASEFNTVLDPSPQIATAAITIDRHSGGIAGVVRAGTLFVQVADPNATPLPKLAASYKTTQTAYIDQHHGSAVLRAQATTSGVAANVLTTHGQISTSIQPSTPLFDPALQVTACAASGGSSGLTDPVLIAAAKANAAGQYGPTDAAIVAAILSQLSVRHVALFPASSAVPYAQVYFADESWASEPIFWVQSVAQAISQAIGFGCRCFCGAVDNVFIAVASNIVLKNTDDLTDTTDIDANVRTAARAYFDNRPDWYTWNTAGLQAALSRADPRILQCAGVSVTDPATGNAIPQPTTSSLPASTQVSAVTHYYLADNAATQTYFPPS